MATFNLWVGLANTKLQEGSPFLPQLQHLLDTRNVLGENGMAISDMQMSFILLDALPHLYSTITGTILASGPPTALSPQDLVQRFINEESHISGPNSSASLTKVAPIHNTWKPRKPNTAASSLSPPNNQGVTCFYCKKDGHKANECHKKKRDLENAKKGKEGQARKNQSTMAASTANNHIVATTIGGSSASIQEIPSGSHITLLQEVSPPLGCRPLSPFKNQQYQTLPRLTQRLPPLPQLPYYKPDSAYLNVQKENVENNRQKA